MYCRHCREELKDVFIDLGHTPPSNAYINIDKKNEKEIYIPLKVLVCRKCWLVQTDDCIKADELFTEEYAYLSSASSSWVEHCKQYSLDVIQKFKLNNKSLVTEVACNDGCLLKNFKEAGIPCLGIEPTNNAAERARKLNLNIVNQFCTQKTALEIITANTTSDLVIANNVYAHVPDINDFTLALKILLKPEGVLNIEFPHLLNLIKYKQFDTIYHEHYSYLSLSAVNNIFNACDLRIWKVEKIKTHGGSLRVYACHKKSNRLGDDSLRKIIKEEELFGIKEINTYSEFQDKANSIKNELLLLLIKLKNSGKKVVAYGAAAKGNTLLNYAGIKSDLISCVFDSAESKQYMYLPGSHIPILPPTELSRHNPDYILILPWNISNEIIYEVVAEIGVNVKFITAIPDVKVIE